MSRHKKYHNNGSKSTSYRRRVQSKVPAKRGTVSLRDEVKKIGIKRDLIFNDTDAYQTYQWKRLSEGQKAISGSYGKRYDSLRNLCAKAVARNIDMVVEDDLDLAPWNCWATVWRYVLFMGKDSPLAFSIFASRFARASGFRAHHVNRLGRVSSSLQPNNSQRIKALSSLLIPQMATHRMENVFSNFRILDLVRFVGRLVFSPFVVLDLSSVVNELSTDDTLLVFNIPNLIALDVSGSSHLDDQFINNMIKAITKDGKLSKMSILKLSNCPKISKSAITQLISVVNMEAVSVSFSYLETDHTLLFDDFAIQFGAVGSETCYVKNSNWLILNNDDRLTQTLLKSSLALKLHILYRHFPKRLIKDDSMVESSDFSPTTNYIQYLYRVQHKVLWDFMVVNKRFNEKSDNKHEQFEYAWMQRLKQGKSVTSNTKCYLLDVNKTFIKSERVTYSPKRPKLTRPKLNPKTQDAKSFFDL